MQWKTQALRCPRIWCSKQRWNLQIILPLNQANHFFCSSLWSKQTYRRNVTWMGMINNKHLEQRNYKEKWIFKRFFFSHFIKALKEWELLRNHEQGLKNIFRADLGSHSLEFHILVLIFLWGWQRHLLVGMIYIHLVRKEPSSYLLHSCCWVHIEWAMLLIYMHILRMFSHICW